MEVGKQALATVGLRTRSKEDAITGKRIPGSASWKILQFIGVEGKEDAENTIKEAEKASSKKKGLVFVFKLLLETLEDIRKLGELSETVLPESWPELVKQIRILRKKEDRLLYIIAYSSVLTDNDASQDMRDLLAAIKTTFQLTRPDSKVTNWKNLYRSGTPHRLSDIFNNLDNKIRAVEEYIKIATDKSRTRERRMARMVVGHAASKRNQDPTLLPYEKDGSNNPVGPYAHIGAFLPDTPEHRQKTIDERKRVVSEEFRKKYHRRRRERAIRRDIELGRITPEEAAKFPADYGRALNTGGRRSRKRKTRKRRRKRTRKKRKSRRKKTNKKRRKKQ